MELHMILIKHPKLFQSMVVQMISVGEQTGKISEMMLRLALFFEEDVTETTKNLSTVIEPFLMIVTGAVVGFFAVSMLQPIYSSLGNI
jgi:type IV pilus assembly protein PilC